VSADVLSSWKDIQWMPVPVSFDETADGCDDFFREHLETMTDLRHALAVLATHIPWASIEATIAPLFQHMSGRGRRGSDANLFGQSVELAGVVSPAGRPRLPIPLMVALLYLGCGGCAGGPRLCVALARGGEEPWHRTTQVDIWA